MNFIFTLVIRYAKGGYNRQSYATLDEAMNAYDNLPCEDLTKSYVELQRGDYYWIIDNHTGIFRRFEDMPA